MFYCNYTGPAGQTTVGPFHAAAEPVFVGTLAVGIRVTLQCPLPAYESIVRLGAYIGDGAHVNRMHTKHQLSNHARTPTVLRRCTQKHRAHKPDPLPPLPSKSPPISIRPSLSPPLKPSFNAGAPASLSLKIVHYAPSGTDARVLTFRGPNVRHAD